MTYPIMGKETVAAWSSVLYRRPVQIRFRFFEIRQRSIRSADGSRPPCRRAPHSGRPPLTRILAALKSWGSPRSLQPSDFASAVLAKRTNPPPWPPCRFSCRAARGAAMPAESVARLGPSRFGGGLCPEPLARNRPGKYKERGLVLAERRPFRAGIFWGVHLFLQKVRSNRDVICERDHSGAARTASSSWAA